MVLQQRAPEPVELKPEDLPTVTDETRIWAPTGDGVIDPRPVLAHMAAPNRQRILEHGGVVLVFCDTPGDSKLVQGSVNRGHGGIYVAGPVGWRVWNFVPEPDSLSVHFDHGEEVTPNPPWTLSTWSRRTSGIRSPTGR